MVLTGGPPAIPWIEAPGGSLDGLAREPERFRDLVDCGRQQYGTAMLNVGDVLSRRWLERTDNPYRAEIAAVAERGGVPGMWMLNLSYEWTCTSGVAPDPEGPGNRLLRTLDWAMDGLGRNLIMLKRSDRAGTYWDLTWPGFVGVATAVAPGRFAAALNQPPMSRWTPSCYLDWLIARLRVATRGGLPPTHLLRRVFDRCATYAEARQALIETPLCLPAFFVLSGTGAAEGCVIERTETAAFVHESPVAIANHWLDDSRRGRPRGRDSVARREALTPRLAAAADDLSWLQPPILNPTTRVVVVANAARGSLVAQGWEAEGPATQVLAIGPAAASDENAPWTSGAPDPILGARANG